MSFDTLFAINVDQNLKAPLNFSDTADTQQTHWQPILIVETKL